MTLNSLARPLVGLGVLLVSVPFMKGSIIQIDQNAFVAGSGLITFSEVPLGTANPTYTPAMYGGGANEPSVSFGGYFTGQSIGTAATCPTGSMTTGCVVGNPTGPLSLAPAAPVTFTANDTSNPSSPVLSGTPQFNGPVSMRFSTPVVGVGLDGGVFNALRGTAITAFDINGNSLGAVTNSQTGIEFLGLVTSDGSATISGLQFSLVGPEPFGFAIDNLRFGIQGQVVVPTAPEPTTWSLLLVSLLALWGVRRWQHRARPEI